MSIKTTSLNLFVSAQVIVAMASTSPMSISSQIESARKAQKTQGIVREGLDSILHTLMGGFGISVKLSKGNTEFQAY